MLGLVYTFIFNHFSFNFDRKADSKQKGKHPELTISDLADFLPQLSF